MRNHTGSPEAAAIEAMAAINDASKYLADNDAFKKTCFLTPAKYQTGKPQCFQTSNLGTTGSVQPNASERGICGMISPGSEIVFDPGGSQTQC